MVTTGSIEAHIAVGKMRIPTAVARRPFKAAPATSVVRAPIAMQPPPPHHAVGKQPTYVPQAPTPDPLPSTQPMPNLGPVTATMGPTPQPAQYAPADVVSPPGAGGPTGFPGSAPEPTDHADGPAPITSSSATPVIIGVLALAAAVLVAAKMKVF